MEMEQQNNKSTLLPILLAVLITIIVVGGGVYWWMSTTQTVKNNSVPTTPVVLHETQTTNTVAKEVTTTNKLEVEKMKHGYGSSSPLWKLFIEDIRLKAPGETMEMFDAPLDPKDSNTFYFATISDMVFDNGPDVTTTNKVYSYNILKGKLTKLYEEKNNKILRTVGIEGSKLILMYDMVDNSPGPCGNIWTNGNFAYLDINNPIQLQSYTVPDYLIQQGKEEQAQCEVDMGLN